MYDESDAPDLYQQHKQGIQVAERKHKKEMDQVKQVQKQEYQDFVLQVYQELKKKQGTRVKKREILKVAIGSLPRQASDHLLALQSPQETPTTPNPTVDPIKEGQILELTNMGFTYEQAEGAVEITGGDTEQAVMLILENPHVIKEHNRAKTEQPRSSIKQESSMSKSKSVLNLNGSRSRLDEPVMAKSKSFTFPRFSDQKDSNNPLAKMGNFLGKAIDALIVDEQKYLV